MFTLNKLNEKGGKLVSPEVSFRERFYVGF